MSAPRLTSPTKARSRAEALSNRLPALLLQAERIAASVAAGLHGRHRAGPGEQFWQYRRYQAGDAANQIDWRATSRSPHVLVREREWEAAQTALLWIDRSPSFNWGSVAGHTTKQERGELLLLALADLLLRGGERVGLLGSPTPPMSGRGLLGRLVLQLGQLPEEDEGLPPLRAYAKQMQFVLFGDFLDPIDDIAARLKLLYGQGLRGHLVQVLDPAEVTLPYKGRIAFEGLEKEGRFLSSRTELLRAEYQAKMQEHQAGLVALTARLGWGLTVHQTSQRAELALLDIFQQLRDPSC